MFITKKDFERILVVAAVVGLFVVYFLAKNIDAVESLPEQLIEQRIGDYVKVCGIIENKFVSKDGHAFLTMNGINIVFFKDIAKVANLPSVGENVCTEGFVELHNKELEII